MKRFTKDLNCLKLSRSKKSKRTSILPAIWNAVDIPLPFPEYSFVTDRKWRIDYAWPIQKVAVEIEGGVWTKPAGRHLQPKGFIEDMEKYNMLTEKGWQLLRYEPSRIDYNQIKRVIENRKAINNAN